MKAKLWTYLDILIIAFIPISSTAFALRRHTNEAILTAYTLLLCVCLIVCYKHDSELLRFRKGLFAIYSLLALIGVYVNNYYDGPAKFVLIFIILMSLGSSTLLIPGVIRFTIYSFGRIVKPSEPGVLEGISLVSSYMPFYVEAIRDAIKYHIVNRRSRIYDFNIQLMVGFIVVVMEMMQALTAATLNRGFRVHVYMPRLVISSTERLILLFAGGGLLCF